MYYYTKNPYTVQQLYNRHTKLTQLTDTYTNARKTQAQEGGGQAGGAQVRRPRERGALLSSAAAGRGMHGYYRMLRVVYIIYIYICTYT